VQTIADEVERQILFEAGEVQINTLINPVQAAQYDPADLYIPKIHAVDHLGLNVLRPPFDDVLARQAVAYAIDYEAMVAAMGAQWTRLPSGILAPNIRGWVAPSEPYYRRDLAMAQDLLDQSAAAGGFDTEVLYDSGAENHALMAQILDPMIWIASTAWLFSGFETDTLWDDWFAYAAAETQADMDAAVLKIQDEAFQNAAAIALLEGPYISAANQNLTGYWQAPWPLSYWDTIGLGG
jgi:peptide/nickel transport system substrate-binding protein